ncbi:MAG: hydrogenase iron-sulfur subunit [Chloroflexi bacterium]|nr:hydrogenase iron-sulfur subunit [Chloroflexota bacterium]
MNRAGEFHVISADQFDYSFADEILNEPGGEHLFLCSSCGTCAATCLVRRFDPSFNPRLLIRNATLGLRQAVLSSREIWECSSCNLCYSRCPHGVLISDVLGAIRNIAMRNGYERPGATAVVDMGRCVACGRCEEVCPYKAITLQEIRWGRTNKRVAQVDRSRCVACGICSGICLSASISVEGRSDQVLHRELVAKRRSFRSEEGASLRGQVLTLVCDWCLHSALDVSTATDPPEGFVVVRVPCTGRVSEQSILTGLQFGATAVLVVGCKEGECHYVHGNELEAGRLSALASFLNMLGVDERRIRFARLGSLERGGLGRLMNMYSDVEQKVPLPIEAR